MPIEENFPLKQIQPIAKVESQRRQFYRPIYSVHKSWARRPGSTFRAIGLSHLYSDPIFDRGEPERGLFYQNHNFNDKIVLDPFCGGGTTLVEFNRLGVKTIGIDVNPVAWFTTKKELDYFNEELFNIEVDKLYQRVGKRIKTYYQTECPICESSTADIMYTFWVRTIICPSCNSEEDLFKYYIIGKKQRKHPATMLICPQCNHLFYSTEKLDENISCHKCSHTFVPKIGNCKLKQFTCITCSKQYKLIDLLNNEQTSLSERQIAIEYYCTTCNTRDYKTATDRDLNKYKEVETEFQQKKDQLIYPHECIPKKGKNIGNLLNYGFTRFSDLFNSRQLLSLSLLLEEIAKISNQNLKEFFLAAFSSSLEFHTVICPYNYTMKQIVNVFNYQSFLVPTMFTENNVWGSEKGNGAFITYLDKIRKAKKYCNHPFEVTIKEDKIIRIPIIGDKIEANSVPDFQSLMESKTSDTLLIADSSEDLQKFGIFDESIDMVVTDPPYFDYISYSELANFFYVWLKLILKETYSQFNVDLIKTSLEIGSQKKEDLFSKRITKVFQECHRVLKPEGPLVFTFHHSTAFAWVMIIQALIDSNFTITASFPIHSEFNARPARGRNFDIILVCRKQSQIEVKNRSISFSSIKNEIENSIKNNHRNNHDSQSIALWEQIFSSILPKISDYYANNLSIDLEQIMKEIFNSLNKVKIAKE